jgi:hypothetical protein
MTALARFQCGPLPGNGEENYFTIFGFSISQHFAQKFIKKSRSIEKQNLRCPILIQ